jgi:hypothetical protein
MTPFRAAREALGWTVADAMTHLALARPTVYSYDSGTRKPHRHTLEVMQLRLAAKRLAELWAGSCLPGDPAVLAAIDAAIAALDAPATRAAA